MKRLAVLCLLACVAVAPAGAQATPISGAITGRITAVGGSTLTVQTGGPRVGVVNALTRAADALSASNYPYVWGGGHALAGVAGVGARGPGYNGRRRGFDCSGSVAAVLSGAGLWPAGSGVPGDHGVIQYLAGAGLIAAGPGRAPNTVNLYDDPGVHIFMSINGRYFGTSDGGGGNPHGGPTWLDDSAPLSYSHAYRRWHFLPGVLRNHVVYGHSYTFQTGVHPELLYGAELGDMISVQYLQWPTGSMGLRALSYAGALTVSGTVTALSGSQLTVQPISGPVRVLDVTLIANLLSGVQLGSGVQVSYSRDIAGRLIPHTLAITSPPPAAPAPPAPTPPATTGPASTPSAPTPPVPTPAAGPGQIPPASPAGGASSPGAVKPGS